ncbi:hypothetical protein IGS73_15090 [Janibacter indicus]|uniref:YtxH domain-containing protein n=1 Tax=Janibacter indicus TaxID=857417 RepID=A0A7L9J151_9MICO|nr:hypothetical protein [Janibacter indicus]QOK22390.1 hypothetical protein IGS73_15090 [Janibacter indicus]
MNKITMTVAFGAGYVLGARAGRERYDQLRDRAVELWTDPKVQRQAKKVQEQAKQVPGQVKQRLPDSIGGSTQDGKDKTPDHTMGDDLESARDADQDDPWPAPAPGLDAEENDALGGPGRG